MNENVFWALFNMNREWAVHYLQEDCGISYEYAKRVVEEVGKKVCVK